MKKLGGKERSRKNNSDSLGRGSERKFSGGKSFGDKPYRRKNDGEGESKRPFREKREYDGGERKSSFGKKSFGDKPYRRRDDGERGERNSYEKKSERPFRRRDEGEASENFSSDRRKSNKDFSKEKKNSRKKFRDEILHLEKKEENGPIRLNKYISNAGICSRREADNLIKAGAVTVNGKVVTEMGFKINPGDVVNYGGGVIKSERKVYILLNKPKDYITTMDDERGRKTVMELIQGATRERVYPVGRLDRNTTGVLLFTNDGELTTKLTHPKHEIKKIYQVTLDKNLRGEDFQQIVDGITLEDGPVKVDDIQFAGEAKSRREVGIEIHSGRNRIVRRLFEHLGYEVIKLDRVFFAGLTKKDLPKGRWRLLSEKEVGWLKML